MLCRGWSNLFESTSDARARESRLYATRKFTAGDGGRTQRYPSASRWAGQSSTGSPAQAAEEAPSPPHRDEPAILQEIRELASMPRMWASAAAAGEEVPPRPVDTCAEPWAQPSHVSPEEAEIVPGEPGTLSPDILHYFASLELTPIEGVDDPSLREKLANPATYGWQPRAHLVSTFRSATNPHLSAVHHFRLTPRNGMALGQMVILSEDGEVFLETAGPWGRTWMYRSSAGDISCRELRTAPVPERLHFRKIA